MSRARRIRFFLGKRYESRILRFGKDDNGEEFLVAGS
jgi:hypothetical protein